MRLVLIAALSRDGVIGLPGGVGMPWSLPDDLKRFRARTMGHPVIMGRRTFDTLGRPLPGRSNVVLTRAPTLVEGVLPANGREAALSLARSEAARLGVGEAFVIGGAEAYRLLAADADELDLTVVDGRFPGGVPFPLDALTDRTFTATLESTHPVDGRHAFAHNHWRLAPAGPDAERDWPARIGLDPPP